MVGGGGGGGGGCRACSAAAWSTILLLLLLLGVLCWDMLTPAPRLGCNLALLGGVSHFSAVVWVHECALEPGLVHVNRKANRLGGGWEGHRLDWRVPVEGGGFVGSVELTGLDADTEYVVQVKAQTLEFRTFPGPGATTTTTTTTTELDVVFGSCSSVTVWPWNSLEMPFNFIVDVLKPRFLLLLGDNVYTDLTEEYFLGFYRIPFETAHRRVLGDPGVNRALRTIPSFVMRDDHEVVDDGAPGHALEEEGLRHYIAYWSSRNPTRPRSPSRLWYTFDYGSLATFFVMDARGHSTFQQNQRIMGPDQRLDFEAWLLRARRLGFTFVVLCSPVSWSDDGHGWLFPVEREEVFDLVEDAMGTSDGGSGGGGSFLILSGDMHFAAMYRYRNGTITELSASPFQGMPFMPDTAPVPRAHEGVERLFIHGMANYMGRVTFKNNPPQVKFEVYTWPLVYGKDTTKPRLLERVVWGGGTLKR